MCTWHVACVCRYDTDNSGTLDGRECLRMLRELMPGLSTAEQRSILADFRSMDLDGDGFISFFELQTALRALPISRVAHTAVETPHSVTSIERSGSGSAGASYASASTPTHSAPPPPAPKPAPAPWETAPPKLHDVFLEEWNHEGRTYLLDRSTSRVFKDELGSGGHYLPPQVRADTPPTPVARLSTRRGAARDPQHVGSWWPGTSGSFFACLRSLGVGTSG